MNQQQHALNDTWVLWIRPFDSKDWSINSYKKVYEFDTIEKFWALFNNINKIENMFFIMRKGIQPTYEDKQNKGGGTISYTSQPAFAKKEFESLAMALAGETLVNEDKINDITGISFLPKNGVAIMKIWFKHYKQNSRIRLNYQFKSRVKVNSHRY